MTWRLDVGAVSGSCLGSSCSPAGGTHFLDYLSGFGGCSWQGPMITACGVAGCIAWQLQIGTSACPQNPAVGNMMRVILLNTCFPANLIHYANFFGENLTCEGPNVLALLTNNSGCNVPATVTVTPV